MTSQNTARGDKSYLLAWILGTVVFWVLLFITRDNRGQSSPRKSVSTWMHFQTIWSFKTWSHPDLTPDLLNSGFQGWDLGIWVKLPGFWSSWTGTAPGTGRHSRKVKEKISPAWILQYQVICTFLASSLSFPFHLHHYMAGSSEKPHLSFLLWGNTGIYLAVYNPEGFDAFGYCTYINFHYI